MLMAQWFVTQRSKTDVYQQANSTSETEGKRKSKPVSIARVPSDSSYKITTAICHCTSLLNISALVFSTHHKKLKSSPDHTFDEFKEEVAQCRCLQPAAAPRTVFPLLCCHPAPDSKFRTLECGDCKDHCQIRICVLEMHKAKAET